METETLPIQPSYDASSAPTQRPLRGHPNYPLPSSLPPQDMEISPSSNDLARATSSKKRSSGSEAGWTPIDNFPQPPAQPTAPEVPKAPPVSYRPLHSNDDYNHPSGYPASFAERARALTGNRSPANPSESIVEPASQPVKQARRGSLNRPIGGVYSEIQRTKRDSWPPPNGLTSPRRFSNPTSPQQYQAQDPYPASRASRSSVPLQISTNTPRTPQEGSRRTSAGIAQPPKKEWAADRSPLQKLEVKLNDISKEEKRARVQEAEQRLRESQSYDKRRISGQEGDRSVDRSQSKRVSAGSGVTKPGLLSEQGQQHQDSSNAQRPENEIVYPSPNPRIKELSRIPRPERRKESLPAKTYSERQSGKQAADESLPSNRDSSTRPSARAPETQQERGVRFRGEEEAESPDGYVSKPSKPDPRDRRRSLRTEALEKSDEAHAAWREQVRKDPSTMADQSASREVPKQQQQLYGNKAANARDDLSTATFGGPPDAVSRNAVQSHGRVHSYGIPPQTASGIEARQAVGFGSGPRGVVEVPAHRKHHLSKVLHLGHNHQSEISNQLRNVPRQLDEWKRAGTARLTTADFGPDDEPERDQGAWWEKGRFGSQRKKARASNGRISEPQSLTGEYQNDTGKSQPSFNPTKPGDVPRDSMRNEHATQTRPYIKSENYAAIGIASLSPLEKHAAHLWHRTRHDETSRLSSAYSYSCPDLAIHDPSHNNHFCEPYMSKELTQSMRSIRIRSVPTLTTFDPPLYLKCGPLLRYTGLRRDRLQTATRSGGQASTERETWRGSVMIVTTDADSTYEPTPTLRLFFEPMELLPTPTAPTDEEDEQDVPSEFIDPVAGLPKLSRSGRTVYVKPVDDLEQGKDLSGLENDDGLFEETRTAAVPTAYGTPNYRPGRNGPAPSPNAQAGRREGRARKKGQQVKGIRLHAERGVTFWRFNLEVELGPQQNRIAYSINNCPAVGFWVPAQGHSMNVMFHSCNGFSMSVNPDDFSGPDPLWRDVLNSHQTRPFHVMIGGGDQIYNDAVMVQSARFRDWLEIKNPRHKHDAEFDTALQEELETFYLERYSMWFSQGFFGMANSQIPMVNMWDDHDIIDGYGSYPHHFMSTRVFCGLGAVAFKYYMLFQHQSVPDEGTSDEPSWLMGAAPGPYINELSRSVFVSLGKNIALLALDCRTERMREEILSEASYDLVFDRCRREIIEGETKHLVVLLGIPIAYPRLVWLENLLTSSVMIPVKALGRTGMLGGFLNKFDGGVEILDDLDDHWTAKHHKRERNWFIQELQELAAEKSVRITILGGDVHLAAVGRFYSNPKLEIPKDRDHRYMVNIISSAIVNTPPPNNMADILNRRDRTHHLDHETDEDMIPMFKHDVNGHPRNNRCLLPRRNWCSIREYQPGYTPPPSPSPPPSEPQTPSDESLQPPTRLQRTLSLTRGDMSPGNLIRRFSKSGPPPSDDYLREMRANRERAEKVGAILAPESPQDDGYYTNPAELPKRAATTGGDGGLRRSSAPLPRPGGFHRRPTNMSDIAATKGDAAESAGLVNLEHGLDVVVNCEINQKDPSGHTYPYRLIIPALHYEGHGDENTIAYRKKSLIKRLGSIRTKRQNTLADRQGQGEWGKGSATPSESEGEEDVRPRRWSFGISQRRQYRDQTPPLSRERLPDEDFEGEDTQQQRQFEHRNQQIGQSRPQPFKMPPSQEKKFSEPATPLAQTDAFGRQDSADYHAHLDSSPPPAAAASVPARKLSKVDRMLGVGSVRRSASAGNGNGSAGLAMAGVRGNRGEAGYDDDESEDYDEYDEESRDGAEVGGKRISHGYSGIEAYSEKNGKGWRRLFGGKGMGRFG